MFSCILNTLVIRIRDNYLFLSIKYRTSCTTTIVNGKILNLLDEIPNLPEEITTLRLQFTIETASEVKNIIETALSKLNGNDEKTFNSEI